MYFNEKKSVETYLYLDADDHTVVTELFIDDYEEPYTFVSATPRELVKELVESGEYSDEKLDAFLDTLYQAVEILENYLNGEEGKND